MKNTHIERRHDIDWLRCLAFILLIFYHIGMYYVADWDWHIKSQHQSELLQYVMLLVNQWRMPLIFLLSGFALALVEPKYAASKLFRLRFLRVFIPLVFAMYFIVPPQVYFEALQKFSYPNTYLVFWLEYIDPSTPVLGQMNHGVMGLLTWNHLWYLAYLWFYTLVYILIKPVLIFLSTLLSRKQPPAWLLFLIPTLILTIWGLVLKPIFPKTHGLFDDWYNHALYFSVFLFGYFLAKSAHGLTAIQERRRIWLAMSIVLYLGITVLYTFQLDFGGWGWAAEFWVYANVCCWLLTVLAYASVSLNKPSPILNYLNEAVLPWYILHQTATIVIAVQLRPLELWGWAEFGLLSLGTFAVCALFYEVIRRVKLLRFLFGMKLASK